jgi:hypothetical protein
MDRAGRARAGAAAAAVVSVAWRGAGMPQSAQQCKVGASFGLALAMSGPISCMLQVMAQLQGSLVLDSQTPPAAAAADQLDQQERQTSPGAAAQDGVPGHCAAQEGASSVPAAAAGP